jgi:hypothetical protein
MRFLCQSWSQNFITTLAPTKSICPPPFRLHHIVLNKNSLEIAVVLAPAVVTSPTCIGSATLLVF